MMEKWMEKVRSQSNTTMASQFFLLFPSCRAKSFVNYYYYLGHNTLSRRLLVTFLGLGTSPTVALCPEKRRVRSIVLWNYSSITEHDKTGK